MFNNINSSENRLFQNNSQQIGNANNVINLASIRANLKKSSCTSNSYIDRSEISSNAMQLCRHDMDVNKFTKIAVSDPDDLSHIDIMRERFNDGVVDAYEDEVMSELVTNENLRDDLGI